MVALAALGGCAATSQTNASLAANDPPAPGSHGGASASLRLARATRQGGDLASAIQIYRSIAAAKPVAPAIVVELGDVLLQSGAPDDAIDAYSEVPPGAPARLDALLGIARSNLALEQPAQALDFADQAARLAPHDARVLVDRGVALDSLQRHVEAQASYRAALVAAPRRVSARNDLALSLALTAQYDEAIALIAPLARSIDATAQVRENLAVIYGLAGNTDGAASVSRMDLDAGTTQANLAFLASVRER
jgi:Flp pilus assembly protein TadD